MKLDSDPELTALEILGLRKCDAAERGVPISGNVTAKTWNALRERGLVYMPGGIGLRLTDSGRALLSVTDARQTAQTELVRKAAVLREAAQLVTTYGHMYPGMSDEPERIRSQLEGLAAAVEELQ